MQQLPRDVLLQICMWLSVRDVLALRRLNKFFHNFTQTSSIWLSLLQRLRLLLPPGQPIPSNALGYHTAEHFISRSMRFQQNWRFNYNPRPGYYNFNCPKRVLSMVSLPGGKYMVSVHTSSDTEEIVQKQNMIVVWDMSFRGKRNHVIIGVHRLDTSIYRLQARYALVGGHISLVIAYVQSPSSGRTIVEVKYAHLALLNEMSRLDPGTPAYEEFMKHSADPFEQLLKNSTRYPVGALSLSEINGMPFLAVVRRPCTIVLYDLISRDRSTLKLLPLPGYSDWKQIFVIRTLIDTAINADDHTPIVFELYDFPPADGSCDDEDDDCGRDIANDPAQFRVILDYIVEACYISDGEASWNFRTHPNPDVPMLHMFARSPPPPLSVFLTTRECRGFLHFLMFPEKISLEDLGYRYDLPVTVHARYKWEDQEAAVFFPGSYHSIVIMRAPPPQPLRGISILQLCTYRTEPYEFSGPNDADYCIHERDDSHLEILDVTGMNSANNRAMKYPALPEFLVQSMRQGTRNLQFDEWLGRLYIVTSNDPDIIHVLDWSL